MPVGNNPPQRIGRPDREFDLSGGFLCLDFANTISKRKMPGQTFDNLPEYSDFVAFAKQSKVLTLPHARELLAAAAANPKDAAQVLRAAAVLREAVYRTFFAIARKRPVRTEDVELIEQFASEAMRHRHLAGSSGRSFRWEWKRDEDGRASLASLLWPIAQSAAELLTSERVAKVRECEASTCAWLFLDESRNHSRRWCDMSICGNRQKARRHYARVKG
jgi:predicted RNA-binding Zn ribbon-like protein